ncbi:hypothetical protein J437_LFUL017177 [Ladona fulva]|uniref:Uncharacterized protein n=1 Tax=Ladona fulva TaxID=123851 RepID=A0A8K0KP76_LADFU|nr:hypothetical protein J437_LFUL017177 [Ladona fulva]
MIQVLCALHFFEHGSYQKSVGSDSSLGISQTSVANAIEEVTRGIHSDAVLRKWEDLNAISMWCHDNDLLINETKAKAMRITDRVISKSRLSALVMVDAFRDNQQPLCAQ